MSEPATLILMPNCYYLPLNYKRQQKRKTHFTQNRYFNSMHSWRNQTQYCILADLCATSELRAEKVTYLYLLHAFFTSLLFPSLLFFFFFFFFFFKLFRLRVHNYSFKFFSFLFLSFFFGGRNFTPLSLSLATPWVTILAQGTNSDVGSSAGWYV